MSTLLDAAARFRNLDAGEAETLSIRREFRLRARWKKQDRPSGTCVTPTLPNRRSTFSFDLARVGWGPSTIGEIGAGDYVGKGAADPDTESDAPA